MKKYTEIGERLLMSNSAHGRRIKRSGSLRRSKKQQQFEIVLVENFPHEWQIIGLEQTYLNVDHRERLYIILYCFQML